MSSISVDIWQRLEDSIGKYQEGLVGKNKFKVDEAGKFAFDRISKNEKSSEWVFKGVEEYQRKHQSQVEKEKKKTFLKDTDVWVGIDSSDPTAFRKAFIKFLKAGLRNIPVCPKNRDDGSDTSKKPTITMETLLGKEGVKLYKLALAEEINSREYRQAVFNASAYFKGGPKWCERLILYIGGPSACGKSYATEKAVDTAEQLLLKDSEDTSGNFVVSADGGIARERSQMRRLVVLAARSKNYSGIENLYNTTDKPIIGKVKKYVEKAVLVSSEISLAIPDTFADPRKGLMFKKQIKAFEKGNNKVFFTLVEGVQRTPQTFEEVVSFMGEARAWDASNEAIKLEEFTLNPSLRGELPESKAYEGGINFKAGLTNSKSALAKFKDVSANGFSFIAKNDLVLIKKEPDQQAWNYANPKDIGVREVSQQVLEAWLRFKKISVIDEAALITQIQTQGILKEKEQLQANEIIHAQNDLDNYIALNKKFAQPWVTTIGNEQQTIMVGEVSPIVTSEEFSFALAHERFMFLFSQSIDGDPGLQDITLRLEKFKQQGYSTVVSPQWEYDLLILRFKIQQKIYDLESDRGWSRPTNDNLNALKTLSEEIKQAHTVIKAKKALAEKGKSHTPNTEVKATEPTPRFFSPNTTRLSATTTPVLPEIVLPHRQYRYR